MIDGGLFHTLIQYGERPERMEYVNVGVVVFDARTGKTAHRLVETLCGKDAAHPKMLALEDFADRTAQAVMTEGRRFSTERLNAKRAGLFHLTPFCAVNGNDANQVAEELFHKLVASPVKMLG